MHNKIQFFFKSILWAILTVILPTESMAKNAVNTNGTFKQGSVALMCTAPKTKEVSDAAFAKALPLWVETLQTLSKEGVVLRAHYLGELKAGIFVIISGDSPEDALTNAVLVSYQLSDIFIKATGYQNFHSCTYTQFGPVAVLPSDQY